MRLINVRTLELHEFFRGQRRGDSLHVRRVAYPSRPVNVDAAVCGNNVDVKKQHLLVMTRVTAALSNLGMYYAVGRYEPAKAFNDLVRPFGLGIYPTGVVSELRGTVKLDPYVNSSSSSSSSGGGPTVQVEACLITLGSVGGLAGELKQYYLFVAVRERGDPYSSDNRRPAWFCQFLVADKIESLNEDYEKKLWKILVDQVRTTPANGGGQMAHYSAELWTCRS
ncbi:hypothetical protein B0T17DRAFT_621499 [Bombardia bombarda]|uniref:Uncharacterized protein n=1 Tax=Bombardia bombarda TaxID=252184 RepID=A0AA39WCA7_9PEZI|nr:hypothetical protein B0T17DRAFT_621499 [Bombardia bombarda]